LLRGQELDDGQEGQLDRLATDQSGIGLLGRRGGLVEQ